MKLSIVVPCYNEEKNIPLILQKFNGAIKGKEVEVVLVNNGSRDNSAEILDELVPTYPFCRVVTITENQGYGYGILEGLKTCNSKFVGWTHADLQTNPLDVIKAFDIISESKIANVFVKGKRKKRKMFDQFFTFGMSIFETLYLHKTLYDINAQPNIFSKEFFESWKNPPNDFSLDLYALYMAQKHDLKVVRFNVLFPERINGTSSWNTGLQSKIKFIKRTLKFSKELKGKEIL